MERNTRQEQAAETRENLLAAAKSLFAEKGYHATPVRAINQKLKMGDGIIYHYFPGGKREVLSVLLSEGFANKLNKLKQSDNIIDDLPLKEALHSIYERMDDMFMEDLELMKVLFKENDMFDLIEAKQLASFIKERNEWLSSFLRKRYEKGEIKNINFNYAGRQFISLCMQNIISTVVGIGVSNEEERVEMIDFTIDLWKNS